MRRAHQRRAARTAQRIKGRFARGYGAHAKPVRQIWRDVFHAVDREVRAAIKQGLLDFLNEQALAADLGKRRIQNAITRGGRHQQFDSQRWCHPRELCFDMIGLPQSKLAASRCDTQHPRGSFIGGLWHSARRSPRLARNQAYNVGAPARGASTTGSSHYAGGGRLVSTHRPMPAWQVHWPRRLRAGLAEQRDERVRALLRQRSRRRFERGRGRMKYLVCDGLAEARNHGGALFGGVIAPRQ